MPRLALCHLLIALTLFACGRSSDPAPETSRAAAAGPLFGQRAETVTWTRAALAALDSHGAPLVASVPGDVRKYCPSYAQLSEQDRKLFWVTFLSALAKHESTWRPDVSGGGGAWHGLLQISPGTARGYDCVAQNAADLQDGALNLSCGIRIMAETVPRDGVISEGMRGVAADWGPFHQASKRADIQQTTRQSAACRG